MLLKLLTSEISGLSSYQKLRSFLLICADKTGAGNMSRTFILKTRFSEAFSKINSLSPNSGFKYLVSNLPYEETQHYPVGVNKRMPF